MTSGQLAPSSIRRLVENQATGGAGGVGGNGGNGQGGGIWNGTPNPSTGTPSTLTIVHSTIKRQPC